MSDLSPKSDQPFGRVYGLYDPATGELRYIGQTTTSLAKRLGGHLHLNSQDHTHKANWLRSLKCPPDIRPLAEAASQEELDGLERLHIADARAAGARLLNVQEGGVSSPMTPETRAKIGVANKGQKRTEEQKKRMRKSKSPEHRTKLAEANSRRMRDPLQREALRKAASKPKSERARQRMSKAWEEREPDSPETRAKKSAAASSHWEDPTYRQKLTEARKAGGKMARNFSPEVRARISATLRERAAQRRLQQEQEG